MEHRQRLRSKLRDGQIGQRSRLRRWYWDQMNGNEILRLMENRPGPLFVAKILCRVQIPTTDCRTFPPWWRACDWWNNMEKGWKRLMESLFVRILGLNLAAPRPPGANPHRAVTREASPRRRGGWGEVGTEVGGVVGWSSSPNWQACGISSGAWTVNGLVWWQQASRVLFRNSVSSGTRILRISVF